MNVEVNHIGLVEQAFRHGAVKIEGYFMPAQDELPIISRASERWDIRPIYERAPRFGALVCGLADLLATEEVRLKTDTIEPWKPGQTVGFHTDNVAPDGLTVLIPLSGPQANFYFADKHPETVSDAKHVTYGVGDAIVMSQHLILARDDCTVERNQTYHVGCAPDKRSLAQCDLRAYKVKLPGVQYGN